MAGMTDRLSATDASFLYAEDAGTPMHVGGVAILKPHPDGQEIAYTEIAALIESRLALVPRYRQKVRFVPGRLARPVWVDDEDFDLTYHVRRSALPRPGTDAELDELVGRLISRPLDRSRPLWEFYVIEGLTDGRIALVNKTHHAMVDRVGAVDVAAAILDTNRRPRDLPEQPWIPNPAPSDIDLVVDAIADLTARPTGAWDIARLAAQDVGSMMSRVLGVAGDAFEVMRRAISPAPRSLLNDAKSVQRRFACVHADLSDLKKVRGAHGGSVNDVVLTVITGALRSWLLSRGEAVTAHTVVRALVPVSVTTNSGDESGSVASYLIDLPVAEPNPAMRLHQVSFAMGGHMDSGNPVAADRIIGLGRFAPPTLHALGARMAGGLSRRMYNLLITNVPGPQMPLYAAGFEVEAMYPVAPLGQGQALAVSCTSYNGQVFFGITADRDAIPDVEEFAAQIREAVEEMLSTVPRGSGAQRTGSPRAGAGPGSRSSRRSRSSS